MVAPLIAFLYTLVASHWVICMPAGNQKMKMIASHIAAGARTFLKTAYGATLPVTVTILALLLLTGYYEENTHPLRLLTFLLGVGASMIAAVIGMWIATLANVRTAASAEKSLSGAFRLAFFGGSVMGIGVVGFALFGMLLCLIGSYYAFTLSTSSGRHFTREGVQQLLEVLTSFSLGAETMAFFARVGGGIYTKAADVGADIVGKLEHEIPEDDPRNPATIADNVGDNVGDVAGMGADLLGSYVATLLAAMVLGAEVVSQDHIQGFMPICFPLIVGALGLLACLLSFSVVHFYKETSGVQKALNHANLVAILLTAFILYCCCQVLLPTTLTIYEKTFSAKALFSSLLLGLFVGWIISLLSEYFTTIGYWPVNLIMHQSVTGAGTNLIAGIAVGMFSTVLPMLLFAFVIGITFEWAGFYGVAMAAVAMMSTTAMQLTMDGFGPIADNAGGIAEMAKLEAITRKRTDVLDAVGNTTAAGGKGFAIASAALTSLGLLAAFVHKTDLSSIDLYKAPVLGGLFVGSMMPFLLSALIMSAVGNAAMEMVCEVRRQFREIPGLLKGEEVMPDYARCIKIATQAALYQMLWPGLLTLIIPIIVGLLCGAEVLAAFLGGVVVVGTAMALFQCNAGGAWDNAKKGFEKGVIIDGVSMGKGSLAHKAAVVGDTVGDPLKDASGPAMNILIKLSAIVALMIAPYLAH